MQQEKFPPYRDVPIEEMWKAYRRTDIEEIRNFLIEQYLHLVKSTAERMHRRLPGEVDVEDLMSAGLFGLMDAIDAFDLSRGVKFETYCTQRIRGAIFDELRAMDWVPRLVRSQTSKLDRVRKRLEMVLGREPTREELSARLEVSGVKFKEPWKDSKPVNVVSLNRKWFDTDSSEDIREIDVIQDIRPDDPLAKRQKRDLRELLTKGLSSDERLIFILYYYEEMTMQQIGITLNLPESRVSQMHNSILVRLRAQMQSREKEPPESQSTRSVARDRGDTVQPPQLGRLEQVGISEARTIFAELLNRVAFGKTRVALQRHGKTIAGLVSAEDLARLEADSIAQGTSQ